MMKLNEGNLTAWESGSDRENGAAGIARRMKLDVRGGSSSSSEALFIYYSFTYGTQGLHMR